MSATKRSDKRWLQRQVSRWCATRRCGANVAAQVIRTVNRPLRRIYFSLVARLTQSRVFVVQLLLSAFPVLSGSAAVPMSTVTSTSNFEQDPFILYSKTLHDYTLKLWTESRRAAEERARLKLARREEETSSLNSPTTQRPHCP